MARLHRTAPAKDRRRHRRMATEILTIVPCRRRDQACSLDPRGHLLVLLAAEWFLALAAQWFLALAAFVPLALVQCRDHPDRE